MGKKDVLILSFCCLSLTALVYGGLVLFGLFYSGKPVFIRSAENGSIGLNARFNSNNLPANKGQSIDLLFFGDLMLDRHVGEKIAVYGLDYLFARVATTSGLAFSDYDLVSANLEGAVTDTGAHYLPANAYDFAFSPDLISGLKKYNFSFFNLANNHLADQGERGIIETRKNLDALSFDYSGCQDGEIGDCSLKKLEVTRLRQGFGGQGSKKFGMAGFSLVYSMPNIEKMAGIVDDLASTTEFVVVNIHWGTEYEHQFSKLQQELAHTLVEAGADIIIGHHPHVVQGMEIYNNKPIFYSLGNFIFDQYFSPDTQEELAVGITLANGKMDITLFPMRSEKSQPVLMAGEEKERFLERFVGWSKLEDNYKEQILEGIITL